MRFVDCKDFSAIYQNPCFFKPVFKLLRTLKRRRTRKNIELIIQTQMLLQANRGRVEPRSNDAMIVLKIAPNIDCWLLFNASKVRLQTEPTFLALINILVEGHFTHSKKRRDFSGKRIFTQFYTDFLENKKTFAKGVRDLVGVNALVTYCTSPCVYTGCPKNVPCFCCCCEEALFSIASIIT